MPKENESTPTRDFWNERARGLRGATAAYETGRGTNYLPLFQLVPALPLTTLMKLAGLFQPGALLWGRKEMRMPDEVQELYPL